MEVDITVNVAAVRALIASQPSRVNRAMRAALNDSSALLLRDMRTYPPARPGSSYVRTGNLRNSWSRRPPVGQGLEMSVLVGSDSNVAPYNAEVQHPQFQAAVHVGRWQTTETVVNHRQATIQGYFDARMREAWAGT